jgi:hypothetical protein
MLRPWVFGTQSSALLETREARQYPIEFESPALYSDDFEIALPDGYEVDELPEATDLDIGPIAYKRKLEVTGRTIRYARTLEIKELSVPASSANALKQFYRAIYADERRMVLLKPIGQ